MYRRSVYYLIFFSSLFSFSLLPKDKIYLSEIRPPYFILNTSANVNLIIGEQVYYSPAGKRLGRFSIVRKVEDEILCKGQDDSGKLFKGCYIRVKERPEKIFPTKAIEKKIKSENNNIPVSSIKISGIKFTEIEKGFFVTLNPLPVTIIQDSSFNGIKRFLNLIKEKSGLKCSVELMTVEEIKKYLKPGDEKLLFGKRGKEPKLIFFSDSGVWGNPVSEKIIGRLKYKIFVPVKLIILKNSEVY